MGIAEDDPETGLITITVPADITTTIGPGRYTDALRVSIEGIVDTLWVGRIEVDANPFFAAS
jgi:hypothetical protein